MGNFGTFYKGEKKKPKRVSLEKKAQVLTAQKTFILPKVDIIKRGKER